MRTIAEQVKGLAERGHALEAFIVNGRRVAPADVFAALDGTPTSNVYVLWQGNNVTACRCGCAFRWHAPHDFTGWSFARALVVHGSVYIESGSMTVLVQHPVRSEVLS